MSFFLVLFFLGDGVINCCGFRNGVEVLALVTALVRGMSAEEELEKTLIDALRCAVTETAERVKQGHVGDIGVDSALRELIRACEACTLESAQKFAIGSSLWKTVASLLEMTTDLKLLGSSLALLNEAAKTVLLQSLQAQVTTLWNKWAVEIGLWNF